MSRASTPEVLNDTFTIIRKWKEQLPVIAAQDLINPKALIPLIVGELEEARQETIHDDGEKSRLKEAVELVDSIVFLLPYCQAEGIAINTVALAYNPISLNGAGKKSNFYERATTVAATLEEGNRAKNVEQLLSLAIARHKHLALPQGLDEVAQIVTGKNRKNRDPDYYTKTDVRGQELEFDQLPQKYSHVEPMLRILRKHYGSPLKSWIHRPFATQIKDFTHHQQNQELLHQGIEALDQLLVLAVLAPESYFKEWQAVAESTPFTAQTAEKIFKVTRTPGRAVEHALKKAGAQLLGA